MRRLLPDSLRFVLYVAAANFLLFALLRLGFLVWYSPVPSSAPVSDVLQALQIGLRFDLRLALFVTLPLALFGWIRFCNPARGARVRSIWLAYFVIAQFLILFLYAVDFGHYGYLHTRLNAGVVEHLEPFDIALKVAWETYPVVTGLLALFGLSAVYFYGLRHVAQRQFTSTAVSVGSWPRRIAVAGFAVLYLVSMVGRWSQYPLRWSDAYFSTNEFVAAVGLNPVLFLADTASKRTAHYDEARVREHYDAIAARLEVNQPDRQRLSFSRDIPARKTAAPTHANLVIIHLESFAAFKTGMFGNGLKPTPNFDAIARDGLLFTNFFVPAVPTARSVFTMVSGIPDYNDGRTASREPALVNQYTLINALTGYQPYYFLGGSAAWGNIRGILSHNIAGLNVFEEGSYEAAQADGWGVSDLVLFEKANAVLKETRKPFFAFIQTSGNHRPYTIPDDKRDFTFADLDDATLHKHGFDGLPAYNGLRFFDYALGQFFDLARKEPYFRNTIFIMYGDHGNPSASETPWQQLGLTGFHVPMVIYAPAFVHAGRVESVASLVDVLPTALGLLSVPYTNKTLGRDLLVPRSPREHFALIPDGLLTDEFLLRAAPQGGYGLYRYRSERPTENVAGNFPGEAAELARLRDGLYETARYLLYFNKPDPTGGTTSVARQGAGNL